MEHDLKGYLTDFYDDVVETDVLMTVEQPDIDSLWSNISTMDQADPDNLANRGVMDNQFIQTSDAGKIVLMENLFNILAEASDTLAFRRQRLLSRFKMRSPFTEVYLREQLDGFFGAGQYILSVDHNNYIFTIICPAQNRSYYIEMVTMIGNIKPCNMIMNLNFIGKDTNKLFVGAAAAIGGAQTIGLHQTRHMDAAFFVGVAQRTGGVQTIMPHQTSQMTCGVTVRAIMRYGGQITVLPRGGI